MKLRQGFETVVQDLVFCSYTVSLTSTQNSVAWQSISNNKTKMPPPPSPIFEKKVDDENQVSYFIWPNLGVFS